MTLAHIDYGYPWWLSYGHLPILAAALALTALAWWRKWPLRILIPCAAIALWATAAFAVDRFLINVNGAATLPTENFLRAGTGRVLDIGAGTGRSSIMVLKARPQTTLVALDLFGQSFQQHFGPGDSPQERLMRNLKIAGVDQRASIQTADMRRLPFEPQSFDAIVSSYAIDHLNRDGIHQALTEAGRVIKPGGEFLLMLVANEPWAKFAFGPLLSHGGFRGATWWTTQVQQAGFTILESDTRPLTLYILARRAP